jgi:hypothetical protein
MPKTLVVPSREVVPVRFPALSERGLARFLGRLKREYAEAYNIEGAVNNKDHAFIANWESREESDGIGTSEWIDGFLSDIMRIHVSQEFDDMYGSSHYYLYTKNNQTFVLMGDNCYGGKSGRVLLNWCERLPKLELEGALIGHD